MGSVGSEVFMHGSSVLNTSPRAGLYVCTTPFVSSCFSYSAQRGNAIGKYCISDTTFSSFLPHKTLQKHGCICILHRQIPTNKTIYNMA